MKTITIALLLAFGTGCAGVAVRPEQPGDRGIRFYRSVAYLLIATDNKGGVTSQVLLLPDTSQVMTAYLYGILATNESTLKFKNGTLTSAVAEIDTGVIPKATLNAIATAALATFNVPGEPAKLGPAPRLYRIRVNGSEAQLIGGNETLTIKFGTTE